MGSSGRYQGSRVEAPAFLVYDAREGDRMRRRWRTIMLGGALLVLAALVAVGVAIFVGKPEGLPEGLGELREALPLPRRPAAPRSPLEGFWKPEQIQIVGVNPVTGQKETLEKDLLESNQRSYIEFRGGEVCTSGELRPDGMARRCENFLPYTVEGNHIMFPLDKEKSLTGTWEIVNGTLRIRGDAPGSDAPVEFHWAFTRLPGVSVPTPPPLAAVRSALPGDPAALIGLWEFEQVIQKTREESPYAPGRSFLEITKEAYCARWQYTHADIAGAKPDFTCFAYEPYTVEGDVLKLGTGPGEPWNPARWRIVDGKLTLEDLNQPGLPIGVFVRLR